MLYIFCNINALLTAINKKHTVRAIGGWQVKTRRRYFIISYAPLSFSHAIRIILELAG